MRISVPNQRIRLKQNNEISALLQLIDDPDEEVYSTVSERLISLGRDVIPNLEELWENTPHEGIQERIESIIHKLHYRDLTQDLMNWKLQPNSLMEGALIVARFHFPDLQIHSLKQEIEKIRRNIWIELHPYLTPLEQAHVFNSILYNYYKQKGTDLNYEIPGEFLLNFVLESRKGNAVGNGILYLILAELLDIPVKAVQIPRQFLLAYIDEQHHLRHPESKAAEPIKFYIDPLNGQIYSARDVENYYQRLGSPPQDRHFQPRSTIQVIERLLKELALCYSDEANLYKKEELLDLAQLLNE